MIHGFNSPIHEHFMDSIPPSHMELGTQMLVHFLHPLLIRRTDVEAVAVEPQWRRDWGRSQIRNGIIKPKQYVP